jgi:hypothetical protein
MFASDAGMRRRDLLGPIGLAIALPVTLAASGALAEEKKKTGGEDYLPLNTLTGTTTKSNGRRGVLTVDCGLSVPDAKLRTFADQSIPRLRAAYLQVVLTYAAGLPPGSPPNPDFIGQSLQRQTDLILGRPGARILLGAVVSN